MGITTFAYLFSAILYMGIFVFRAEKLGLFATLLTIGAFLVNTAGIGMRWYESHQMGIGYAPLSNMYESLVFFAWAIAIVYLFMEIRYKNRFLGAFSMPFAALAMILAGLKNPDIKPLIPALQSNWLIAHVVTCFIGYAAFAVAGGIAVMYLLKDRYEESQKSKGSEPDRLFSTLPALRIIDDMIYKCIIFGFVWLSTGIITGAIWANEAWGTYWSWDPKETWSLITWFVYAAALHARFVRGWSGKRIAWIAIIGCQQPTTCPIISC